MRILHYILGFPPHRTGGLTKYALGLVSSEKALGHDVTILYPGNTTLRSTVSTLRNKGVFNNIRIYQLTNGIPIPLLYGVRTPNDFMQTREIKDFDDFFSTVKPDVFHVHTLMGLPIEFLKMMKEHGVKIVYTTHDYFGLCLRVNFIDTKGVLCENTGALYCSNCCRNALPTWLLRIRNSKKLTPLKRFLR